MMFVGVSVDIYVNVGIDLGIYLLLLHNLRLDDCRRVAQCRVRHNTSALGSTTHRSRSAEYFTTVMCLNGLCSTLHVINDVLVHKADTHGYFFNNYIINQCLKWIFKTAIYI